MDPTQVRQLGSTGLMVTALGYGGGSLGNFYRIVSDEESSTILEKAWNAGIRYFDTAPYYGRGRSERRIGSFLATKPRGSFVLSSKVGRLLGPARGSLEEDGIFLDPSPFNARWDYSYEGIMRSHEDSLQRLGLDHIDILYVHDLGRRLHGEIANEQLTIFRTSGLKALQELQQSGCISGYGLGVTETDVCMEFLDYADPAAFLLAGRYTLLEQRKAEPLLEACASRNVSLVIGGVFASGILATGPVAGARFDYGTASEDVLSDVRRLAAICENGGTTLAAAALQFPFRHRAVASVLIGAGQVRSLEDGLRSFSESISEKTWSLLCP